ncbi:bifunctional helix-turn-helix transcriptional regulator/GNAT family N-acetyltransferase [Hyalangium versicolor]|uniref:bifunctional helix-turn-helix transcriptional regulator/GNAT family N-acetyltransferase n=1 Tax=Hyalangium versicolor TaxID=2861190 RepID=UPI001CCAEF63|nr:helix-turn-helix domain-containing GNAT family N-acetyltransferase [Hyalangium versicolor]
MADTDAQGRIEAVRSFNRFYTQKIGVLQKQLLKSPFSLTEARVLYELAHRDKPTATELGSELGLDAGYLSRILRSFEERGLIAKQPSEEDARRSVLSLEKPGREVFAALNARSDNEIGELIGGISPADQQRLVDAMRTIQELLGSKPERKVPYILRPHQPGDMGWVTYRHGVLYSQEYGWDERFEALVASVVAEFIQKFDPKRERCWIAERDGEIVGSVFLVKKTDEIAKLRLLLVEPKARGLGIGVRLVDECLRFARQVGYRKMTLWTNNQLAAARNIYQKAGFRLVASEPHDLFGTGSIGETWEREL